MDTALKEEKDLSKKVGEDEIDKIINFYEIDIEDMEDKKQKKIVKDLYNRLVKAARKRRVEVEVKDGTIIIKQHLRNGNDVFEYKEIDGEAKLTFADKDENNHYGKIHGLMGHLSGQGEKIISKLKGTDMSLTECLATLLLQV